MPKLSIFTRLAVLVVTLVVVLMYSAGPAWAQIAFSSIIRNVQITQVPNKLAYQVDLFVSILDEANLPIQNLKADAFTVLQDSKPVSFELSESPDQAMSVVILVDTSGSMAGSKIEKASQAISLFIEQLSADDSVALISFNNKVTTISDFSTDHKSLLRELDSINSAASGGTCLFDALYQAAQMSTLAPQGRRGILVLTDGRDELAYGNICSSATVDDVIRVAGGSTNTPIYSIGIGNTFDENSLQRLALLTGGTFLKSSDSSQLALMFDNIQAQLKNQYLLSYISNAAPGNYTVTVKTVIGTNTDTETREMSLPDLGPMVRIVSPEKGADLTSGSTIEVEFIGKKDTVASVRYEIGGALLGEVASFPFALKLEEIDLPVQAAKLTAIALDVEGNPISSDTIDVVIPEVKATITSTSESTPEMTPTPMVTDDQEKRQPNWLVIGIVASALILLLALLFFVLKPFKSHKEQTDSYNAAADMTSDATFDSILPAGGTWGQKGMSAVITVGFSDDSSRIGEKIVIQEATTHIGRSTSNEISFPKDHPVSRRHAVIEYKDGQFVLSEALTGDESGMKSPTFGTYVNDENIGGTPTILRTGDEIRLGNRLKLRFDILGQPTGEDRTLD